MLVITRREGEQIVIGDPKNPDGIITITKIKSDRIRVGLEFPIETAVHRKEVADDIIAEYDHAEKNT